MQFQSTLTYLKSPPTGYQQPAVDFQQGLQLIQDHINQGYYRNEYAFEADLQHLIYSVHDGHVNLYAGVMNVFSFGSPVDLVSVSLDGKQVPEIYLIDELLASRREGWTASPIITINDVEVVEYLTEFAALNSIGMVEPHADWNQLMDSPALDIQGVYSTFAGVATFYPGDRLHFGRRNGSVYETRWWALYNSPGDTGPLITGGDFYNFFVLGFYPASYDPSSFNDTSDDPSSSVSDTYSWYEISDAYPEYADLAQPDLAVDGAGILTAYFLHDISTAVISIPSFYEYGDAIGTFQNFTSDFVNKAQQQGMTKVIIDLQQNGGGDTVLAFDTFKKLFPRTEPFAGSRMRAHDKADVLGSAITGYWENPDIDEYLEWTLAADEWVATDRLNAETGQNFSSWAEFFGPRTYNGDNFTLTERYNLSSYIFDVEAFAGYIPSGYSINADALPDSQPWAAEDIVILTDGQCGSACALFVEMMTHDAGVRTIVAGGRPVSGPMQAVSGTRGARSYSSYSLDAEIAFASAVDGTAEAQLPQNRFTDLEISFAGFNLRDQIRESGTVPLQFLYEAADCRIYYTVDNFHNFSRLWRDAASATWKDTSLCVEGSTGYTPSGNSSATKAPPPAATGPALSHYIMSGLDDDIPTIDFDVEATGGLPDKTGQKRSSTNFQSCSTSLCSGSYCRAVSSTCSSNSVSTQDLCLPSCLITTGGAGLGDCPGTSRCRTTGQSSSRVNRDGKLLYYGYCYPASQDASVPCPNTVPTKADTLAPAGGFNKIR